MVRFREARESSNGKTKNTHLCEMISLAKKRGITPEAVVMDAWYSSLKNLKSIKDHGLIWITSLAILAWIDKYRRSINDKLSLYQQDWNVIKHSITNNIKFILNYN